MERSSGRAVVWCGSGSLMERSNGRAVVWCRSDSLIESQMLELLCGVEVVV